MSGNTLRAVDEFLRGAGRFAPEADPRGRTRWLIAMTVVFSAIYGIVMGGFGFVVRGETRLLVYPLLVAFKTPALLLITFALCVPSFYVVNAILGLRDDFAHALRAVTGTLACLSVALAAMAPLTLFFYFCTDYYDAAILFNGLIFAIGCGAALGVVRRYYGPLIRKSARHRAAMMAWFLLYIFVAIQMAWTLRPFIGDPNPEVPIVPFRSGDIDNAYLEILRLFGQVWRMWRDLFRIG